MTDDHDVCCEEDSIDCMSWRLLQGGPGELKSPTEKTPVPLGMGVFRGLDAEGDYLVSSIILRDTFKFVSPENDFLTSAWFRISCCFLPKERLFGFVLGEESWKLTRERWNTVTATLTDMKRAKRHTVSWVSCLPPEKTGPAWAISLVCWDSQMFSWIWRLDIGPYLSFKNLVSSVLFGLRSWLEHSINLRKRNLSHLRMQYLK